MTEIAFRNVRATRIKMPISLWGDREVPVRLSFENCEIGFAVPHSEFVRGAYMRELALENVRVTGGVNGPLVRLWHAEFQKPEVRVVNVVGVGKEVRPAETAWNVKGL